MPVRYKVLSLMFLLTLVTYLDRVCISATAPAMSEELGLTKPEITITEQEGDSEADQETPEPS